MTETTGARRIVTRLVAAGATHLFGYPGESSLPLYQATNKEPGIVHVMARCERCAGYMADGYARATNSVGLCDAPGGVGTPWLVPALHESFTSAVPIVALTTSSPDLGEGRWPTTHCDNAALFSSVSKAVLPLRVGERIEEIIDRALWLALSGRPGPVVIDIEPSLLTAEGEPVLGRSAAGTVTLPRERPRPDRAVIAATADRVLTAARPLLVLGGGIHTSAAYPQVQAFVDALGIPAATTFNGKGALPEDHPQWAGVIGAKGQPRANHLAESADLVLWVGSKGGDKSTQYGTLPPRSAHRVQVDIDPEALGRTFAVDAAVCSDLGAFLDDLREAVVQRAPAWQAAAWAQHSDRDVPSDWGGALVLSTVRPAVGHPLRLVADASKASSWSGAYDRTPGRGRWVWAPRGSGTLGYALPAAVGAAVAHPDEPVVVVNGDGGFAMSAHEIETAVAAGARLAVIVLDNSALGLLEDVGRHSLGADFRLPGRPTADWALLARAYGAHAAQVFTEQELAVELTAWQERGGVVVLDAVLPGAEISPDLAMFISQGGRSW
ncbi:thiamine pyrophosphate-binding protein [Streptomyces sp. NPDC001351]|uniref:thiamine pyrophosphate-binding protein n=1 Tax=Streptomyces sp. NPDC001351 TaxID=3364564 RepID=UPI0036B7887C